MSQEEDEYFLPLQDQQVFGAGIRRKRVAFVRAGSEPSPASQTTPESSLGDRYLAIVQPQNPDTENPQKHSGDAQEYSTASGEVMCTVCNLPTTPSTSSVPTQPHESSLAHQVCLPHSHPPSYLDRDHVGLRYLSSYGWDPDARLGLGASGTGIRAPVKCKVKNDTVGLGVKDSDHVRVKKQAKNMVRLNAKQMRLREAAEKKREVQLRDAFYGKDLEAYLGPGG